MEKEPPKQPNVLWLVVDCLRHDALSANGYHRETTPHLKERTERDFVSFDDACTQSSFTFASASSMLTGLYPDGHGAKTFFDELPTGVKTFGEYLETAGRDSHVFPSMNFFDGNWGLERGFSAVHDLRDYKRQRDCEQARAEEVITEFEDFLQNRTEPFASLLWFFDVHTPWLGDARFSGENEARDRYDSEIKHVDEKLEALFCTLERNGEYDNTIVVVTGDHGELFDEHPRFEGFSPVDRIAEFGPNKIQSLLTGGGYLGHLSYPLYEELLHVPLYVKFPRNEFAGRTVEKQVELIDILPTVLEELGIEYRGLHGEPLRPVITGESSGKEIAFAETMANPAAGRYLAARGRERKILRELRPERSVSLFKQSPMAYLIRSLTNGSERIIARGKEGDSDGEQSAADREELGESLDSWLDEVGRPGQRRQGREEMSSSVKEDLENLGYL